MPIPTSVVGRSTAPHVQDIDARWTMAYAASIGDELDAYFNTSAAAVPAHPLFAVCVEWPSVGEARRLVDPGVLPRAEAARGVHAGHELTVHRLIRAGDRLSTVATVESVQQRPSGAQQVLRLDTVDRDGEPVSTTRMTSLFLGVDVAGDPPVAATGPVDTSRTEPVPGRDPVTRRRAVARNAAHVYTECARIWNPIHTDVAVASAAGLPGPILHGTATLAMAVSEVVRAFAHDDPSAVTSISCRFRGMVTMPNELRFTMTHAPGAAIGFQVRTVDDQVAVDYGAVELRS